MRSTNCGNVPADWRASIGPIGNPWHRITAGRRPGVLPVGTVRWQASVNAPERNEPFTDVAARVTNVACARRAEHPASPGGSRDCGPRRACRGRTRCPTPRSTNSLDDGGVLPLVEVVHQLRALVTDVSVVLEPGRALHGR